MKNYNKILEAINKGIQFALDDFDDQKKLIGQQTETIKDCNITSSYLELQELFKQIDEIIKIMNNYSSIDAKEYVLRLNKIKFGNTDLARLIELSKKLGIKYKINPNLIHYALLPQLRTSDGLVFIIKFITNNLKNYEANLNWIDTSNVESMQYLFAGCRFNGDISEWDVSHVKNMGRMFKQSWFNGDISKWDVSNVDNMYWMFYQARQFNQDISNWKINTSKTVGMFVGCKIKEKYKPKNICSY